MTSMRYPFDFESRQLTHPLPQVVLTVPKTDFLTFQAKPSGIRKTASASAVQEQ